MAIIYEFDSNDHYFDERIAKAQEKGFEIEELPDREGMERWRVYHVSGCPHHDEQFVASGYYRTELHPDHDRVSRQRFDDCKEGRYGCRNFAVRYREIRYRGAVLCDREKNYHDDSDFYAICYDRQRDCLVYEEFATTRFGGGGSCSVDATPEVKELAAKANARQILRSLIWASAANDACKIDANKRVRLLKPFRKKVDGKMQTLFDAGTEATVLRRTEGRAFRPVYNSWAAPLDRLLVRFDDGQEFWCDCDCTKFEVADPQEYLPDYRELEAKAAYHSTTWHLLWGTAGGTIPL